MKIKYVDKNFRKATLDLIEQANEIIADYQRRGYELTLRQLYYQLVARDIIPNSEKMYKQLGASISNARDAGLVDWNAIVDRTRNRKGLATWDNPGQIVKAAYYSFRTDKWETQKHAISVWVEKEALAGIVANACSAEDIQVDHLSCRGYMSASTIWREAVRIERLAKRGKTPVVIHLGDHDPSGIDMSRDNIDRLKLYSNNTDFVFERIALNHDQIQQYNPPPNPAKMTDSRIDGYVAEFGTQSWELDALDPDVLIALIREKIEEYKDELLWEQALAIEKEYKAALKKFADSWED